MLVVPEPAAREDVLRLQRQARVQGLLRQRDEEDLRGMQRADLRTGRENGERVVAPGALRVLGVQGAVEDKHGGVQHRRFEVQVVRGGGEIEVRRVREVCR